MLRWLQVRTGKPAPASPDTAPAATNSTAAPAQSSDAGAANATGHGNSGANGNAGSGGNASGLLGAVVAAAAGGTGGNSGSPSNGGIEIAAANSNAGGNGHGNATGNPLIPPPPPPRGETVVVTWTPPPPGTAPSPSDAEASADGGASTVTPVEVRPLIFERVRTAAEPASVAGTSKAPPDQTGIVVLQHQMRQVAAKYAAMSVLTQLAAAQNEQAIVASRPWSAPPQPYFGGLRIRQDPALTVTPSLEAAQDAQREEDPWAREEDPWARESAEP
jgi:hypothetical protein